MSVATAAELWGAWPSTELLFDAELSDTDDEQAEGDPDVGGWAPSLPLFVEGASAVDLYFDLRAPALITPRWCTWYLELSPTRRGHWFRETFERMHPDGSVEQLARTYRFGELEPGELSEVFEHKGLPPTDLRRHVRIAVRARYLRVVLRGTGGHARLWALASP